MYVPRYWSEDTGTCSPDEIDFTAEFRRSVCSLLMPWNYHLRRTVKMRPSIGYFFCYGRSRQVPASKRRADASSWQLSSERSITRRWRHTSHDIIIRPTAAFEESWPSNGEKMRSPWTFLPRQFQPQTGGGGRNEGLDLRHRTGRCITYISCLGLRDDVTYVISVVE